MSGLVGRRIATKKKKRKTLQVTSEEYVNDSFRNMERDNMVTESYIMLQ
jgi:hypothetical protein